MEIIVGKNAGFCFGVKRAVEGTMSEIKDKNKIYCLGELVHNRKVIEELQNKGVKIIDDLFSLKKEKAKVIIRAHGVDKSIYEYAKENEIEIIDYTCPFVIKIHKLAETYSKNDFYIFLIGSKEHPEIKGTSSYCDNYYDIIETQNDVSFAIKNFNDSNLKKLLVIVQTTFSLEKFNKILEEIKNSVDKNILLEVKNTICNATKIRQDETNDISKCVECMIIIGGKNSSNTKKLYEISINNCKNTFLVENEKELEIDKIKKYEKVGIMAGASTPYKSIENIINMLK